MFSSTDRYNVAIAAVIALIPGLFLARDGAEGALTAGVVGGVVFGIVFFVLKSRTHRAV